jgi:hypothetical protein
MVDTQASVTGKFHVLAANPGKQRTEVVYLIWFLLTMPIQGLVVMNLSYDRPNDPALIGQSMVMALGTLILPLIFRAPADRGLPLRELYGFRMGVFLTIWAVLGGFIGTDPWYEVLHGHFAFNTALNPNGVPLFMLPMTISVFSFYTVILGTLYRLLTQLLDRAGYPRPRHHGPASGAVLGAGGNHASGGDLRLLREQLLLRQRCGDVGTERVDLWLMAFRGSALLHPV